MSIENDIANLLVRVYEIHEIVIAESGGLPGLRDAILLHSSVARPFATFAGEELYPTDFDKAAALFHSLIKNHPFMDGTKRTAFASTLYFLEQSGYHLPDSFPIDDVVEYCESLAMENVLIESGERVERRSIREIADWLQQIIGT